MSKILSLEAMLIRHGAAISMVQSKQLDGWDALLMVIDPSPDLMEASLAAAEETGPSKMTLRVMENLRREEIDAKATQRQISLDDLLASL